jgi:hypothetical protein
MDREKERRRAIEMERSINSEEERRRERVNVCGFKKT